MELKSNRGLFMVALLAAIAVVATGLVTAFTYPVVFLAASWGSAATEPIVVTAELVASIAGGLLALGFAYIPKVKDWFDLRTAQEKAGIMALALIVVSVGIFAAGCASLFNVSIACTQQGAVDLVKILVSALVANQSLYLIAVKSFKPQARTAASA